MKKNNTDKYFKELVDILKELHSEFPDEPISRHIGLATEEYNHIEDIPSDKELVFLLTKYQAAKILDHTIPYTNFDLEEEDDEF